VLLCQPEGWLATTEMLLTMRRRLRLAPTVQQLIIYELVFDLWFIIAGAANQSDLRRFDYI